MAYKFIGAVDLFTLFEGIKTKYGFTNMAGHITTTGCNSWCTYLPVRDLVSLAVDINGGGSTTSGDVLAVNPVTLLAADAIASQGFSVSPHPLFSDSSDYGLPDLIYISCSNDVSQQVKDFDVDAMAVGPSSPNWDPTTLLSSGGGGGTINGGYNISLDLNGGWTVFGGLKDGVPGGVWTPGSHRGGTELVGTNVYPGGLMLAKVDSAKLNNGQSIANAFAWIDVATGTIEGVAMPELPGVAQTTIADFAEQPLYGNSFNWLCSEFIADIDSSFSTPKGELFLSCNVSQSIPSSAFANAVFVKFVDFNPLNIPATSGAPTRVHGRVSQVNAIEFNSAPSFDVPGAATMTGLGTFGARPFFHRPSRRIFMFTSSVSGGSVNTVGQTFVGYWSRSIQATANSAPVPLDVPRTADITSFETFVSDSLGQPVGGNVVNWSLFRNSTEGELLTITGGVATTSTVAHGPIDTTALGAAVLSITANGVALALTIDYTVVASTGVITWVTDQSGKTVLATYEHRTANASPAHGTLITTQSVTDEIGRAIAQVRYLDDDALVGKLDRLIATFTP